MRFIFSSLLLIAIDQLSKLWVINNLKIGESLPVINGILSLTYVQNKGAAFGILQGKSWFFIISAFLVISLLTFYNFNNKPINLIQYISGFIVGGSVGNLIDRLLYGSVVDFFSVGWWPVFNVADIGIVCGSIGLLIYLLISNRGETEV